MEAMTDSQGRASAPSTSHIYGCCAPECREHAVTRVEVWRGGWGWVEEGDFCRVHASEMATRAIDFDTRKVPLNG